MAEACLTFRDLTLGYNRHLAVRHLNGVVGKGSLTAVIGGNGSCKSTLMKSIVGKLRPLGGSCAVAPGTRPAYLPQLSELDRSFPARVAGLVSLGLWPRCGLLERHRAQDRQAVSDALMVVGLEGFEKRPVDSLSGGQLQRALFVLVQDADLVLLDEPFDAVAARTITNLVALIKNWHGAQRTVMVVAHNAFRYFERDYGVFFLSPQGVSAESEASAGDAASLIREIREKRAVVAFAESISDARLVEQIASEAGLELGERSIRARCLQPMAQHPAIST
nr:zinc ABC transporter substrate-binding protein [Marinicella sp. W31]MDC2880041.1 zinc ABC transporter substrate-binding protein [Marinicella sp. W31]